VTVTVQVEDAAEVWITVDDGEAVALEPVGDDGTEFVGEIAVLGESWNGIAHGLGDRQERRAGERAVGRHVHRGCAPAAGPRLWKKKSTITPSKGNAVAVDAQGEVYELFTEWSNPGTLPCSAPRHAAGSRCGRRMRSPSPPE
jgi:hypothetical protein